MDIKQKSTFAIFIACLLYGCAQTEETSDGDSVIYREGELKYSMTCPHTLLHVKEYIYILCQLSDMIPTQSKT